MQRLKKKKIYVVALMLLVLTMAASEAHQLWQINKAQIMSEELFKPEQPNPVCFGRLMIDLPKHAVVTGMLTKHPGAQDIEMTENVSQTSFEKIVQDFEQKLRTTKHETASSLFKSEVPVSATPNTKLFTHFQVPFSDYPTVITGYRLLENGRLYRFQSKVDDEFVQKATKDMLSALMDLRVRSEKEIPAERGFCIEGAFFPDTQTGEWLERANLAIDFEPWADMNVSIESRTNHKKQEETLLDRLRTMGKRIPALAGAMSTIRSGQRDIGPHKGEEVLVELNKDGRRLYTFVWEVQGEIDRNDLPNIHVEMRIGHGNDGKYPMPTKEQMFAAWEYILSHLRMRPTDGDMTQTRQAEPPKLPLGELAATGRLCPQTGWWECVDAGNVQGGRRQHFTAGEAMPHAILLGEPSVWQKLKGERPMHQIATVWKLVGHDEEPAVAATAATAPEADASIPESDDQDMPPQADADDDDAPKAG